VGKLKDVMEAEEWTALVEAMADPKINGNDIAKALQEYGHNIAGSTLGRHRRRANGNGCQCEPD
jgi:hypothetical protein